MLHVSPVLDNIRRLFYIYFKERTKKEIPPRSFHRYSRLCIPFKGHKRYHIPQIVDAIVQILPETRHRGYLFILIHPFKY